ncbi:MAG: NAD-dependent epimerase/dehydratase family protein [Prolixibacteraceae bacterium]|nr:NAD-dependent epimerase/dehydratase family protein [Prolixibacteraceae bacterium]
MPFMLHQPNNVFIAGGTGFIGYHASVLFLKQGCIVSTIALPGEIDLGNWYPKKVVTHFGNLFEMGEDEIAKLLKRGNYDTFVYCLGPDDRETPGFPAYAFFYSRLVVQCVKICRAAKSAGIKRCVVLNSYFACFDRLFNGKLSQKHPYIRCRVEQAEALTELGEKGKFDVMIMELPYVFGAMPERFPIWKKLFVEKFRKMPFIIFPGGSTAAVHVQNVVEAIFAAACNGKHGGCYPICSANIKYSNMFVYMMACAGFPKKHLRMPRWVGYFSGFLIEITHRISKRQSGLNMINLMSFLLHQDLEIDTEWAKKELRYTELGFNNEISIWLGIREAMKQSYPETYRHICETDN